jgi:hypothetical protein
MTRGRAPGPGPRTVALRNHRPARPAFTQRTRSLLPGVAVGATLALLIACGTATPASTRPGVSGGPVASAVASGAPGESGAAGPSATPRRWARNAASSLIALAAADTELAKAGADLQGAVDREDLAAMRGAADGLATLVDKLIPNIADLEAEPTTQPIAAIYRASFPEISAGAKQLRDAITAGDANGILAGTQRILAGLKAYAPARDQLPDLVGQALTQQRLYTE